jgi:cytochrome c-type biogenesis protein CcmE
VVALSIAGALAIFLLYTAIAGQGTATLKPSQLSSRTGRVQIVGTVIGPVRGNPYGPGGQHFRLRDIRGTTTQEVPVVYTGDEGALFGTWKHILVTGELRNGVFVARPNSMITKCPSKYIPKKSA